MERNKLLEYFNYVLKSHNIVLTEDAIKYINGEEDELSNGATVSKIRSSIPFPDDIVKELKGENSEIAKRILRVIFNISGKKILSGYNICEDVEVCGEIGIDFNTIIQYAFLDRKRFTNGEAFEIIEIMYKYYKEELIKYTEDLITYDIKDLLTRKYIELYPLLICGQVIYFNDKENYKEYLFKCVECLKRMDLTQEVAILLNKVYKENTEILELVKNKILEEPNYGKKMFFIMHHENFLQFLKENNMPLYPYYGVIGCRYCFNSYKKGEIFNKIYHEDKETIFNAYQYLLNIDNEGAYALRPLALMLNDGYALDECEKQKLNILKYSEELLDKRISRVNPYEVVLRDNKSAQRNVKKTINSYGISYSAWVELIKVFIVYYDFDETVKKFIDFIISIVQEEKGSRNLWHLLSYFVFQRKEWLNKDIKESIQYLIEKGFTLNDIFLTSCMEYSRYYNEEIFTKEVISELCIGHEKEAIEFLDDSRVKNDIDITIEWIEQLYYYNKIKDYNPVIKLLNSKSKKIRNICEEIILSNEEYTRKPLEDAMIKFKGEQLKLAKRVIKQWDNEHKYGNGFEFTSNNMVIDFVNDNYDEDIANLVKWIDDRLISNVRFKSSNEFVPPKVLRYIFMEYMALSEPYKIQVCHKIIEFINKNDFEEVLENVYSIWLENGADTKLKNITIPYAIYGNDNQILKLRKQIENWAMCSRGALGAYVVNSIALNGGKVALLIIDEISRKFPNAMVKKAASKAFSYAAKALNIPQDELSDKIIPNLGFNKQGEKVLDYGERKFKVSLMNDFTLSIFDESKNKIIKSLPKPNESDNIEMAEDARKEFSQIKKQIKTIIQTQKFRLEKAIMNGRPWGEESFKELFVENPIMHIFAIGLIWGVYENGVLKKAFRYMEDGTFNTVDEEEYILPKGAKISLVHPIDLSEEELEAWKNQLEDYEIVQPVPQLEQDILIIKDEEIENKRVIKFNKRKITVGNLLSIAKKYNMIRGEIYDGGSYESYYIFDDYLNIDVKIDFEDMYVGINEFDEEINLGEILFYKCDANEEDITDEIKEIRILDPKKVCKRFVSSILSLINNEIISN